MRDPATVWIKLKELYHAVSEASIDAKLSRLQQIKIGNGESIIKYTNWSGKQAAFGGHHVRELEKKRALLRRLNDNLKIITQIIRTSNAYYTDDVSQLIVY